MKNILPTILLVVAALPSFVFAQPDPLTQEIVVVGKRPTARPIPEGSIGMRVTTNYIVRNLNGDEVCHLKKGDLVGAIAATPEKDRVQIKVQSGPCANITNAFVYVNYLRPANIPGQENIENALVEVDGLSLRKAPNVDDGTFLCSLPSNTKLKVIAEKQRRTRWVQVEMTDVPKGCPTTGWVAANYLKPDFDVSSLRNLSTTELTEAGAPQDCKECTADETSGSHHVSPLKQIVASGQEIQSAVNGQPQRSGAPNPFTDFAKDLQKKKKCPPAKDSDYKCNRGLMQMPVEGNAGFCGTHHYSPDRPAGVDAYASPQAACSLVGLAQEWKKTTCPNDNKGCRIAWGDISHRNNARFNGHQEHTNGECIDIRPFNTGSFRDAGRTVGSSDYDRATTEAFIKMAKKYGGSIMYSDSKLPKSLGVEWGGRMHNNHLHVCFEARNATVQKACDNLNVDPAVCSEVQ